MEKPQPRITYNAAMCRRCGDTVESTRQHHFASCSCGALAVDGGHDPLCPQADPYSTKWEPGQKHWSCHCDLIAKVRADERGKTFASLDTLADLGHADDCRDLTCGGCIEEGEQ